VNITFRTAGEVVKRWVNEVQESIREENKLCFLEFAPP
jgi:translation initiation factor 2 alpha subunit (eIF-2alpha)